MASDNKLVVSKSNPILDMKNNFNLYQQRMLNLYLAKINPLDPSSRHVAITLSDFVQLLGITEVSVKKMRALAEDALDLKVDLFKVELDDDKKKIDTIEMDYIGIWERFRVHRGENGQWIVELVASTSIMPYLFQIKDLGYLNFPVLCALRMRSPIAEKLYEQCARFKDKGVFTITLDQLRKRLGIDGKPSYDSYNRLKNGVLLRCIKEINESTDIYVEITSENREHRRGAPVKSINFSVKKNRAYNPSEADRKLQKLHDDEEAKRIVDEMRPIDVAADRQISMDQYALQDDFGLSEANALSILHDKETLGLSDEWVREVIAYSIKMKPDNLIGYIRHMLREPAGKPLATTGAQPKESFSRNPFNNFEQNVYDFEELEKDILGERAGIEPAPEMKARKSKSLEPDHMPPYYVVMGSSDAATRLAAYAALGIPGDNIKILSPEEYARLSKPENI